MRLIDSKQGQFYLFTALVLIIMVAGILPRSVQLYKSADVFEELLDNFMDEAPFAINNAVYMNQSIKENVNNFSINYLNYAKHRDPNFGFVILLKEKNETIFINRLKEKVSIKPYLSSETNLSQGELIIFGQFESFNLTISDGSYVFPFENLPEIQLKMLFKSAKNGNIYIKEVY